MERHEKITQSVWNECKKASVLIVDSVELMAADTIRIFPFSPFKTQKMGFATLGNVVGGVVSRYLMYTAAVFPLKCATAQYHQTICVVLLHSRELLTFQIYHCIGMYISHSPFNDWNASLFACMHGCAVACAYYATKQTFAHRSSAAQLYFICFVNSCFRWVAVG